MQGSFCHIQFCIRADFASQLCCKLSTVYSTVQHGALYDKVQKEHKHICQYIFLQNYCFFQDGSC